MTRRSVLVLRLAAPLQSWGVVGEFNRRDTGLQPSKSGVVGLLAAAQGRPRSADISDLVGLRMGVRIDAAGSVLRDYHTVSDYSGRALLSASVLTSGLQKRTSPVKHTHVTERFYLQDATFVVAIEGPIDLLGSLVGALARPVFPLALGRRSCAPSQPLVILNGSDRLWHYGLREVLELVPWQVGLGQARRLVPRAERSASIRLAVTLETAPGDIDNAEVGDFLADVPVSFEPRARRFVTRNVRHGWVSVATPFTERDLAAASARHHDPFDLLGEA